MITSLLAAGPAFHGGPPFFPFFLFIPIFWVVVIVLFFVFAVGGRRRRMARWAAFGHGGFGHGGYGPWGHAARGAESTLAERFAQGDIDEKEYRARLEVLRANNGPQAPTK